ncbi:MAG: FAD-dependent monooxygenase [Ktedonobacteraceae bacterium]|nr:FAD-dependent monooxygenase [Ktedonobacteraceae bacterium]
MNTPLHRSEDSEFTPVLIVGGGLIGLSTSLFLSWQGIPSILIERHPGTAIHPRAMGMSPRTMEMFRAVGIEEDIRRIEPPVPQGSNVPLVESLMGQEFDCLQEDIDSLFSDPNSAARGSAIAQDVLEPVLRARAEQLGGDLRFRTELVAFEEDEEGITATIRERGSESTKTVRTRFLVAADGSKSAIRKQLGIGQHGTASMGHFVSMIFEADLMKVFHERHAIMCFLSNDTIAVGSFVPYPGSVARPDLFRVDVGYDPDEEKLADYPEERCLQLIRAAAGIPDLKVGLKAVLNWEMNALVADRFQQGRVLLVGDAARTQPPSGGLGGNTGIAEAHNLAWKLAAVVRGEAGEALLATYDAERRPVADYTAEQMTLLSQQRQEGSAGITVDIVAVNTGYRYGEGAFAREEGDEHLPLALTPKQWRGQPGTRAAYLALEQGGKQISTLDLIGPRFVLLIGPDGRHWKEAAQEAKDVLHLSLDSYQIGGEEGDLVDVENRFCDAYGIAPGGAVLVRPDGFIGWRSQGAEVGKQEAKQALVQALSTVLFR